MEVKFLTSLAGVNFSYVAGSVAEVSKKEAQRLVKAGYAEEARGAVKAKDLSGKLVAAEAKIAELEAELKDK